MSNGRKNVRSVAYVRTDGLKTGQWQHLINTSNLPVDAVFNGGLARRVRCNQSKKRVPRPWGDWCGTNSGQGTNYTLDNHVPGGGDCLSANFSSEARNIYSQSRCTRVTPLKRKQALTRSIFRASGRNRDFIANTSPLAPPAAAIRSS